MQQPATTPDQMKASNARIAGLRQELLAQRPRIYLVALDESSILAAIDALNAAATRDPSEATQERMSWAAEQLSLVWEQGI